MVKIILYLIGGGGHKHSDGQRNEITESSNTERTNEELIQSRSIDHLLCGGDGNKTRYKNLEKLIVYDNNDNEQINRKFAYSFFRNLRNATKWC